MLKNFILYKFLRRIGISENNLEYITSLIKVSKTTPGLPKELFDLNILNFIRGVFSRVVIATNMDWVLPYWVEKQYDSSSKSFVARGFQFPSLNMGHRNWTMIGGLGSRNEAVVDERGLLVVLPDEWSVDFWLKVKDKLYVPSRLNYVDQRLLGNLPVVVTEFIADGVLARAKAFMDTIGDEDIIVQKVKVRNQSDTSKTVSFYYSVRPYNVEGMSLIKSVKYQENVLSVDGVGAAVLMSRPDRVMCSNYKKGDVSLFLNTDEVNVTEAKCDVGLCTFAAEYNLTLAPDEFRDIEIRIPINKIKITRDEFSGLKESLKFDEIFRDLQDKWKKKLAEGMQIQLPDSKVQEAYEANKAYMLVFHDIDSITPGPFIYHSFWFRDAAYMINALDKLGYHQESESILRTYPQRQQRDGFFLSQKGEWDSNGESLWVLFEHYRLLKDKGYLSDVYPAIKKGADWLIRKLTENDDQEEIYQGLLPQGMSAEHFGFSDYYYWDDFWALAGLRISYQAAEIMGDDKNGLRYKKAYDELSRAIDRSLAAVAKRMGQQIMPISPNRRMDSAAVGVLSCIYPTQIFPPDDPRLVNTVKYMEENQFNGNGFFHDINHSGFGTYLTTHFIQYHIYARSPRAVEIMDWLVDVATSTYTWPESINPLTLGGCIGDGHHGWAAADFIVVVRNMLFFEEDSRLVILPTAPKRWFKTGCPLKIDNAPSYFGVIAYEVRYAKGKVEIIFNNSYKDKPSIMEINLPFVIKEARIGKQVIKPENNRLLIDPDTKKIEIIITQ